MQVLQSEADQLSTRTLNRLHKWKRQAVLDATITSALGKQPASARLLLLAMPFGSRQLVQQHANPLDLERHAAEQAAFL